VPRGDAQTRRRRTGRSSTGRAIAGVGGVVSGRAIVIALIAVVAIVGGWVPKSFKVHGRSWREGGVVDISLYVPRCGKRMGSYSPPLCGNCGTPPNPP